MPIPEYSYDYESERRILSGMVWIMAHWLLPAKASKEDALDLIERARQEYKTGLDLKGRESW
jgi:hypothetical protein